MSNINITEKSNINNISQEEINIQNLKEEIIKLKYENEKLRKKLLKSKDYEIELNKANEYILQLIEEKKELMNKQNEEIKKYKIEMENILNEKDFNKLNYDKRLIIFEQKMGKVNELELENEVFKEEVQDLKKKNKELEIETDNKIKELEVKNQLKFKIIKKKVMNHLTEAKENMIKYNIEHMDINSQLINYRNNKLAEKINIQNKGIKKLTDEKNKLKLKILDLETQRETNKKIQIDLANKLNIKNKEYNKKEGNSSDINLFNKKNKKKHKKYFSTRKNFFINNTKEKFLDSNIFNKKEISLDNKEEDTLFKNSEKKPRYKKYKSENNTLSKTEYNSINIKSDSLLEDFSGTKIKYNQIISQKNFEIKNLHLKLDNLNNRISFFFDKYKKLYNFLEECLNTFFWELKGETNFNINYEELTKFNFNKLNKREKYSVLILLMNHLIPIITFNFNSNCNLGNNIFSTNINIFDKTFNKTYKHLNDEILKKSFFGKNNKLQQDLFIKKDALFNGSIPVLRKSNNILYLNDNNNKLNEDKYKFVL
jgi:hypothetical protein